MQTPAAPATPYIDPGDNRVRESVIFGDDALAGDEYALYNWSPPAPNQPLIARGGSGLWTNQHPVIAPPYVEMEPTHLRIKAGTPDTERGVMTVKWTAYSFAGALSPDFIEDQTVSDCYRRTP